MPRFLEMEKQHRSLIFAMLQQRKKLSSNNHSQVSGPRYGLFVSLGEGMKVLIQSLEKKLPAGSIELNAEVVSLRWDSLQKLWGVRLGNGKEMEAEAVCLALPAYRSGHLLEGVDPEISKQLRNDPVCLNSDGESGLSRRGHSPIHRWIWICSSCH